MNVLEAVRQLDKYSDIVSALRDSADYQRSHQESYKGRLLDELADEYQKKASSLKENLEKTSLTVMRGVD